jgi:hypothetical protein
MGGSPDLFGETPVALRLTRLLTPIFEPGLDRSDDVVEPLAVLLGSVEFEFGLAAAGVEPRSAGGFFEQEPPFDRLCAVGRKRQSKCAKWTPRF